MKWKNYEQNRSSSWEFGDNDTFSTDEPVSEVMEFFEVAASLIRTLAPDSGSRPHPTPAASS